MAGTNGSEGLSIQDLAVPRPAEESVAKLKKHLILKYTINSRGCWIHNNKVNSDGYVVLNLDNRFGYKMHRLSYVLAKGSIPKGLSALHTCDVRNCINPDHLYAGTDLQNVTDMYDRGRNPHVITEDEIGFIFVLREKGLSQEKIARMLGLAQTSIGNHLRRVS